MLQKMHKSDILFAFPAKEKNDLYAKNDTIAHITASRS